MIGLGISLAKARGRGSSVPAFTPASLFAASEAGTWNELRAATVYTDAGGTVAATLADQIASTDDLSGNGNRPQQITSPERPRFARVPVTGRRNLLEYTEEFDNAAWAKVNVTVTADADGAAEKLTPSANNTSHLVRQFSTFNATATDYTFKVKIKDAGYDTGRLRIEGPSPFPSTFVDFDLAAESVTSGSTGSGSVTSATITAAGDGYYLVKITGTTGASGSHNVSIFPNSASSFAGDGTSGIFVKEAQVDAGDTAYQKVVSEFDITEAGVDSVTYAFDDEVDDSLNWTAPAGTYTVSYVNTSGIVTTLTGQALSGVTNILLDPALVGYLAIDRALTAGETSDLETYWGTIT